MAAPTRNDHEVVFAEESPRVFHLATQINIFYAILLQFVSRSIYSSSPIKALVCLNLLFVNRLLKITSVKNNNRIPVRVPLFHCCVARVKILYGNSPR